jgi:acyl-CoA-binding protein
MAERLRLYGYYKRATIGPASGAPPQGVDFKSRSKHEAWQEASGNSRSESMILYVHLVNAIEARARARSHTRACACACACVCARARARALTRASAAMVQDERVRSRVLEARKKRTARRTSVNWDPELGQSPRAGGAAGGDQGVALPGGEPMLREGLTLMPFPQHGDPSMRSPAPFPHFFFVWVDPEKPAAARDEAWPLPDTYRRNVEHWSERYQVSASIYGGDHCLRAVWSPRPACCAACCRVSCRVGYADTLKAGLGPGPGGGSRQRRRGQLPGPVGRVRAARARGELDQDGAAPPAASPTALLRGAGAGAGAGAAG